MSIALIAFINGCSYLFPEQFKDFTSPEELDKLPSETIPEKRSTTEGESVSKKINQKQKSPPSNQIGDQVESSQAIKQSNQVNQRRDERNQFNDQLNSAPNLNEEEVPSKKFPIERNFIEIALSNPAKLIKLNTPQPLRISFNNKTVKASGDLKLKACGGSVCIQGMWTSKTLSDSIKIEPKYDFLQYKKRPYRGVFTVKNIQGKIVLINQLELESYLRGVLPHEIGVLGEWGQEALKAQAVAARTYTVKYLNRRRSLGFDLYADTRDQMYLGLSKEYPLSNNAIESTKGIVMTYDKELIEAYYYSTCGGQTADISKVWGAEQVPYLISRPDLKDNGEAWCSPSSLYQWEYYMSHREFTKQLSQNAQRASREINSKVKNPNLKITQRSSSGRIQNATLKASGKSYNLTGDKVRWLIQPPKANFSILPSSKVKLDYKNGQWHIHGKGFGHGIGLCQYGARERSRAGQSYQQILNAYYHGIRFSQLN